ncbi:MAG: hypothetical protein UY36_C0002G0005 [Parcubacteria group bacterium GW2011_GWA1_49_11]|nr:MAG: hypothetical protein UY36_C0002G0005 [Parcubacteria group bacterium GW2011_GWA1_49_11]
MPRRWIGREDCVFFAQSQRWDREVDLIVTEKYVTRWHVWRLGISLH